MNGTSLPTVAQPSRSLLLDAQAFDQMQRVGRMLAVSPLFPEHLRKGSLEMGIANGVLVMNMAARLNEDPLTVAQNIYFVGGKPGWSASYMIGKANQNGVFRDPIDWDIAGKGDTLSVTAFAVLRSTGKRVSVTCDMAMAKAEGWTKNVKYQSMPQQMLRYRSATFMIRLYCPEVMIGIPSSIENELGMRDVTPDYDPTPEPTMNDGETVDAETGDVEQTKPEVKADPKPKRDEKPTSAQQAAPKDDAPPQDSNAQPDPVDFTNNIKLRQFVADVQEVGMEGAFGLWAQDLDRLKSANPDLHAAIMAAGTAADNARQ